MMSRNKKLLRALSLIDDVGRKVAAAKVKRHFGEIDRLGSAERKLKALRNVINSELLEQKEAVKWRSVLADAVSIARNLINYL